MANYCYTSRTSYFKPIDMEAFKALIRKRLYSDIEIWERSDGAVAFGGHDVSIFDYYNQETEDHHEIIPELQALLPEGEVIAMFEVGFEKLRYVTGIVCMVTRDKVKWFNLDDWAKEKALELVGKDIDTFC